MLYNDKEVFLYNEPLKEPAKLVFLYLQHMGVE